MYLPDLEESKGPNPGIHGGLASTEINVSRPCLLAKVDRPPTGVKSVPHLHHQSPLCLEVLQIGCEQIHQALQVRHIDVQIHGVAQVTDYQVPLPLRSPTLHFHIFLIFWTLVINSGISVRRSRNTIINLLTATCNKNKLNDNLMLKIELKSNA